ncbi:MAG: hypothetical protein ABI345_05795 [Jatrophihabitans sp.]
MQIVATVVNAAPSAAKDSTSDVLRAIGSLAWPVIVVLALWLLKDPLRAAVGRISEVDVGSTKVVLQKQADDAANTTKAALGTSGAGVAAQPIIDSARAKATTDPSGAVLDAWAGIEDVVRRAPTASHGAMSASVTEVVNALASAKSLDGSLVPVARSLEALRAMAAAKPKTISPAMATSFVAATGDLARLIDQSL